MSTTTTDDRPAVGAMIEVPAWQTFGMVMAQGDAMFGPEGSVRVLLQEYPDQPARLWRYYTLAPGEWEEV